jgi:D-alanyl-lipoteichoic acid acyltransferase DltB (MBOAT superfamily)
MLFNSLDFAVFLPIVFVLYWFATQHSLKLQNLLVTAASYLFYGWWDWRFLSLIFFSTIVDFGVGRGLALEQRPRYRKALLWTSIVVNLGFLGVFKYYAFFLDNFVAAFSLLGYEIQASSLNIVLPVGISFYTFQTLSYSIDVYRGKLQPSDDFVAFAAFVSFFPQLVAGPIERATSLLPQFQKARSFQYGKAVDGLRQVLWGLFKKVVIADNCAEFADQIFNNSGSHSGSTLLLGALFFTFQIYGDFSGYSDIAIGTARLFGFELMQNFAFPYFSRDIAEFWRRWHISLSTWFRDYLYIPIGGSRGGKWTSIRNTFIIFLVSGFWHGANWTFLAWGGLHAAFFLPLLLSGKNRRHLGVVAQGRLFATPGEIAQVVMTFGLTTLAWVFFRAENLSHAFQYLSGIASVSLFSVPIFEGSSSAYSTYTMILLLLVVEWQGREQQHALASLGMRWSRFARWSAYSALIFIIGMFMQTEETPFIYFQF